MQNLHLTFVLCNVRSVKNNTKCSSNTLLYLVSFFTERTLVPVKSKVKISHSRNIWTLTSYWVGLEFNPSISFRMSMPFRDGHRSSIRNSAQIVAEKVANWLFKDGGAKFMLERWQNLRGIFQKLCNIVCSK